MPLLARALPEQGTRRTGADAMTQNKSPSGLRTFAIILTGQFVSLIGSGMTGFALGVWVFQTTRSATQFSLMSFCGALPAILVAPLAGVLVDRWDRRWAMILTDFVAGLAAVAILLLVWFDALEVWHLYIVIAVGATFSGFQQPAFNASVPLLVPKRHLGRAAGFAQATAAGPQILTPILAGALLVLIELKGILVIDLVTMSFAIMTLLVIRIPRPPVTDAGRLGEGTFFKEAIYGWTYLRERPGLMAMLILFAGVNFALGMMQVLLTPLVLSFGGPEALGKVLSVAALGFAIGSILMGAWGGPKKRVNGILGLLIVQALILLLGGLRPSVTLVATAAFVYMLVAPVIMGCSQVIWQTKVAPGVMGRVFAFRRVVALSTLPLAYLIAGPLAEFVFEPWLAVDGALAGTVGAIIGVGPGRGIGLLYIVLAGITILAVALGYSSRPLRNVEEDLPDAIPDEAEAEVSSQPPSTTSRPQPGEKPL
ncbi:MAG: MFS transporter [bacterium]|nr:MFS transporter [bacterium]